MRSRAEAAPGFVWVESLGQAGDRLALDDEASHYVARACRARPGEGLHLTDGAGGLAIGRVIETRPRVVVEVAKRESTEQKRDTALLCGAPEGERADWLVEKLAELGLSVFQPVDCERATWERAGRRFERWQRVARAALRQSRSRFLLDLRRPLPLEEALVAVPRGAVRLLAHQNGVRAARLALHPGSPASGVVGPSAGLSPLERSLMEAQGFQPIALSDNRLRTETAAVARTAWWASQGSEEAVGEDSGPLP